MSQNESYYYGQGKVELAEIMPNGSLGPHVWIGDVSELSGSLSQTPVNHRESYSGIKAKVREFFLETEMSWSATLHQLDVDNIARFTQGKIVTSAGSTVTGEAFPPGLDVGDVVTLEHPGVSDLVIIDDDDDPLDPEHYTADVFGDVTILSLPDDPSPDQPFSASYTYAATRQVALLAEGRKEYALRYRGINLAENNRPVIVELYKLSPSLLQTLSVISSGNQLAGAPVTFTTLLDTSKPATGDLGQFGRIIDIIMDAS